MAENENGSKTALSFGFKKKIVSKVDETKIIKVQEEEVRKEFLSNVDENTLPQKKEKEALIIPLIKKNRWLNQEPTVKETKGFTNDLQSEAAKEIMKESAEFMDTAANVDSDKEFEDMSVPLLMKNKAPDGFETDEKLDVSLRPDEASAANYDEMPVGAFGMAMLRGMNWDPKVGIGRTFKTNKKIVEPVVRPKGLGLGAVAFARAKEENNSKNNSKEESIELKKEALVQVQFGRHKNKYGVIQGMDFDNAQCLVKFALEDKPATVGESCLKIVSKSEYSKYAKDLSRLSKAHESSQLEQIISNSRHNGSDRERQQLHHSPHIESCLKQAKKKKRHHDEGESREDAEYPHKRHERDYRDKPRKLYDADLKHRGVDFGENSKSSKKRTNNESHHHKSAKKHKNSPASVETNNYDDVTYEKPRKHRMKRTWLQPNLRVRMVDEKYRKGKFHREKLLVVDVYDADGHCSCKTDRGTFLDDLHEDMLETVVPRSSSDAYVKITSRGKSKYDGKLAKILEKNKEACEAYLQLIEDRDIAICVSFDDICEYVGDVEADLMF